MARAKYYDKQLKKWVYADNVPITPVTPDFVSDASKGKAADAFAVGTELNKKIDSTGGKVNSNLDLQNHKLINVKKATDSFDAVNYAQLSEAIESLGTVFDLKGSKPTFSALPKDGNMIGDVWYVEDEESGYIWLNKEGVLTWERFGPKIDLSGCLQFDTVYDRNKTVVTDDQGKIAFVDKVKTSTLQFTGGSNEKYDGSQDVSVAIPTELKNPNALTFTGNSIETYDGSSAKTVAIPKVDATSKNAGEAADAAEFGKHLEDKNNPHEVTRGQIGAIGSPLKTVTGEVIAVDDVSPLEHSVGCKVSSKNLAALENPSDSRVTIQNGDIIVNGSFDSTTFLNFGTTTLKPGDYYFSKEQYNGILLYTKITGGGTFNLSEETDVIVLIRIDSGTYDNIKCRAWISKGIAPTPYTPYIPDLSKVTVSQYGGNILNLDGPGIYLQNLVRVENGLRCDETDDYFAQVWLYYLVPFIHAGMKLTFKFEGVPIPGTSCAVWVEGEFSDGQTVDIQFSGHDETVVTYIVPDTILNVKNVAVRFNQSYPDLQTDTTSVYTNIQLSINDIPYQEFIEAQTFKPDISGTVSGMTSLSPNMTLLTDTPGALLDVTYRSIESDPVTPYPTLPHSGSGDMIPGTKGQLASSDGAGGLNWCSFVDDGHGNITISIDNKGGSVNA